MEKKNNVQKFQYNILVAFIVSIVAAVVILTMAVIWGSSNIIRHKTTTLFNMNSTQLRINLDSYFESIEKTGLLLFVDDEAKLYDATDTTMPEYDKIQMENAISKRLMELGVNNNFSDFAIVYRNNDSIGQISNGTRALIGSEQMYEVLENSITDAVEEDGWFSGSDVDFIRLYYVKRINENAILFCSVYGSELSHIIKYPNQLEGMSLYVINAEEKIVYSTADMSENDAKLLDEMRDDLAGTTNTTILNSDVLATVETCSNGWNLVCAIPTSKIMAENRLLFNVIIITAVILCLVFIRVGSYVIRNLMHPMQGYVEQLSEQAKTDKLSGLLNKAAFEQQAKKMMAQNLGSCMMLLDMDHFKNVNDSKGHQYGDQVIARTGRVLQTVFGKESHNIGRIGGDEFAILISYTKENCEDLRVELKEKLDRLYEEFNNEFDKEIRELQISLSIGIDYGEEMDFDTIYRNSDRALYMSKKNGKNRYTIYNNEEEPV